MGERPPPAALYNKCSCEIVTRRSKAQLKPCSLPRLAGPGRMCLERAFKQPSWSPPRPTCANLNGLPMPGICQPSTCMVPHPPREPPACVPRLQPSWLPCLHPGPAAGVHHRTSWRSAPGAVYCADAGLTATVFTATLSGERALSAHLRSWGVTRVHPSPHGVQLLEGGELAVLAGVLPRRNVAVEAAQGGVRLGPEVLDGHCGGEGSGFRVLPSMRSLGADLSTRLHSYPTKWAPTAGIPSFAPPQLPVRLRSLKHGHSAHALAVVHPSSTYTQGPGAAPLVGCSGTSTCSG